MGGVEGVVVVTGGAQGLGLAYGRELSGRGAQVVLADIRGEMAAEAAGAIRAEGGRAEGLALDVTDEDSVADVFGRIAREQGTVTGLVNNAGGAFVPPADIEDMAYADFLRVLAVNAGGTWLCSRAVVPGMKGRGRGKIVNVSSTCFSKGYPTGMVPYIAAKGGVVGITRALARELGRHGITVNAVAPGYTPVPTGGSVNVGERKATLLRQMIDEQCMPRTEVPGDLVGTVAFLVSHDSDFVTGQVVNVDGGWAHN